MSEITLYRKYRPSRWVEVAGQDHVVGVLEGAIKMGNIAHAYLFSGTRGTGKTSVARIFAGAIGTTQNDLYEIDAASSRGIDEIRELREGVRSLPFESKYKVYIIDEVHMLTKEAFNALLKTLEEPPAHVIFILATTERHKLPETIISRCQTFAFKKPPAETLQKLVMKVAKTEGFSINESSANLIGLLGDGSFRDALGILQKVMSISAGKKVSEEEIEAITGAPSKKLVFELITALLSKNLDQALAIINQTAEEGKDIKFFLKMILTELRLAMLSRLAPEMKPDIEAEVGADELKKIIELTRLAEADHLPAILKELLSAYEDTGKTYLTQLPLELAVVKITKSLG